MRLNALDWLFLCSMVVGIASMLIAVCIGLSAHRLCLAAGWPVAEVDYTFTAYCIKRVDQTDVVKPLREIK